MKPDDHRFCARCGVVRELHDDPDHPTPADCDRADRKADLISRFPV